MNAIETDRLGKRFRRLRTFRDLVLYPLRQAEHVAVEDLTLQIGQGELFGLLGENGAGKTTLIRMLATTLLPTEGTATVAGHDVVREAGRVRELVGLANGDDRSFYWRLTGRQNLEFFAALNHLSTLQTRTRISSLLELFDINDEADTPFYSYSTGTRHKFSIVRGLLTEPVVLLLDEPTRSLDPAAAADVRRLLVDHVVGELGHTVLLATHSLAEAEAICDRVGILRAGRLVACGSVAELRRGMAVSRSVVVRVKGLDDGLARVLEQVDGVQSVAVTQKAGSTEITLGVDRDRDILTRVVAVALERGANLEACELREPTVEDVYRQALGAPAEASMAGVHP